MHNAEPVRALLRPGDLNGRADAQVWYQMLMPKRIARR